MATVAEARTRRHADVRWVLFIEGIEYAFTTDNGLGLGGLLGSGASSWIGLSEAAIEGVETVGARTVRPGLTMPQSLVTAIDPKSGDMEPNPTTFGLHDYDGVLANLFAREKPYDVLRERLGPGTTALPATALGQGGGAITIRGRNVGIERVGAAGERRLFPALPFSLVGYDHAVLQNEVAPGTLAPVKVSDEPVQWSGRMVTVYEVYRDPDATTDGATAWPTWDAQDEAGCRAWTGVLIGVKRQRGRVWQLQCHGIDALQRKQLGTVSSSTWMPVAAELNLEDGEDEFAVYFQAEYTAGSGDIPDVFNGSIFDRTVTATNKSSLTAEIDGFIQDASDGTSTNLVGGNGDLEDWAIGGVDQHPTVRVRPSGVIEVTKDPLGSGQSRLVVLIGMHARVWRQLGYEPETQNFDVKNNATDDPRQIMFHRLPDGHSFGQGPEIPPIDTGIVAGAGGYWIGRFTSVALGASENDNDSNSWDNDGKARTWEPKFPGEPFTLDLAGGQLVRLGGGASPYIEGQLSVRDDGLDVDGSTGNRARYFAFRGKVQRVDADEPEDTIQVARVEWHEDVHGSIATGTGASPVVLTRSWMDPRVFGFNYRPLTDIEYWTGTSIGEGAIEAAPLNAYAYTETNEPEFAGSVFSQILLSSGSSPGYTGDVHATGENTPAETLPGIRYWGLDVELADLGCAVPHQLLASQAEINEAFTSVPGGWSGPLCRVRHCYLGPFLAQDVLASILRPRRLVWRLHGGVLSVVPLAAFSPSQADVTVGEGDLYPSDADDPTSLVPEQEPDPHGHLDAVILKYGYEPQSDKTAQQATHRARDAEAKYRTGELEETIADFGLVPYQDWGPWPDTPTFPWVTSFAQLWSHDAATFFAGDHHSVSVNVARPVGQSISPGSRVLLSNPWPADDVGGYGLTNRPALAYRVAIDTKTHARHCDLFVFGGVGQGVPHFAFHPMIVDQSGAQLTLSSDQYGHGNDAIADTDGLQRPSWASQVGDIRVRILYRQGPTYGVTSESYLVLSFDPNTHIVVLSSAPDTALAYSDRWLVPHNYDAQSPATWPRYIFGAIVRDDFTHSASNTVGRPFLP